jgi:tetratricopeptide (TPR) repeat protein
VLTNYGALVAARGDLEGARRLLEEGLRAAREGGDVRYVGAALARLGAVALAAGAHEPAASRLEEALAVQRELGDSFSVAGTLLVLGQLEQEAGDHDAARSRLEESLEVAQAAGDRTGMCSALERLARLALAEGRPVRAVRIYGAVSVLRETVPVHPYELGRPDHDQALSAARSALGEAAFGSAWADGRALTLADVLGYAREAEPGLELASAEAGT